MEYSYLAHHGVKGQKWYQRRYQNKDGTLTPEGKARYKKEMQRLREERKVVKNREETATKIYKLEKEKAELKKRKKALKEGYNPEKKKSLKELSDEELKKEISRLNDEKTYLALQAKIKELSPKKVSRGEKIMNAILEDLVVKPSKDKLKEKVGSYMDKKIDQSLSGSAKSNEKNKKTTEEKNTKKNRYKDKTNTNEGFANSFSQSFSGNRQKRDGGSSSRNPRYGPFEDVYYDDVTDSYTTSRGQSYVENLLMPPKKKRRF